MLGFTLLTACAARGKVVRDGYLLCWACAEALDAIRAFAARLVNGDGTAGETR